MFLMEDWDRSQILKDKEFRNKKQFTYSEVEVTVKISLFPELEI